MFIYRMGLVFFFFFLLLSFHLSIRLEVENKERIAFGVHIILCILDQIYLLTDWLYILVLLISLLSRVLGTRAFQMVNSLLSNPRGSNTSHHSTDRQSSLATKRIYLQNLNKYTTASLHRKYPDGDGAHEW